MPPARRNRWQSLWAGLVFFSVFLVLPLLYGLVNRAMARKDDVWLVVINASWTSFYLWTILFERYQTSLALWRPDWPQPILQ